MKACFNSKTGELRDQADSFKIYPGDEEFIAHVAKTYGDDSGDLVVVETDEPWKKELVNGEAVDDSVKINAIQAEVDSCEAGAAKTAAIKSKLENGTATSIEVQKTLAELLS